MITVNKWDNWTGVLSMSCLSADIPNLPTDTFTVGKHTYTPVNGSTCLILDASTVYAFDAENSQWVEL